jgi:hypothetical protein
MVPKSYGVENSDFEVAPTDTTNVCKQRGCQLCVPFTNPSPTHCSPRISCTAYIKEHKILEITQAAIKVAVKQRAKDPAAVMAKHLTGVPGRPMVRETSWI